MNTETQNQHTPGPWSFYHAGGNTCIVAGSEASYAPGRLHIAQSISHECTWTNAGEYDPIHFKEANAQLIAAAPDLLAALQNLMGFLGGENGMSPVYVDARAAIARATGADA